MTPAPPTPSPTPPPTEPTDPPATPAAQDRRIAQTLAETRSLLATARDSPEIRALLAERGVDEASLTEGEQLLNTLQSAYDDRQSALDAPLATGQIVDDARTLAEKTYADFRRTVRAAYKSSKDSAALTALGAAGPVPGDIEAFLILARTGYAVARRAPYAPVLARRGYGTDNTGAPTGLLARAVAALDAFETARQARGGAAGEGMRATQTRNAALDALKAWADPFKEFARLALADRSDLSRQMRHL